MKTNEAGLKIIRVWEGLVLEAYKCPAGVWTIGYGHTSAAGPPKVIPGMKIDKIEADEILKRDIVKYEKAVEDVVNGMLNENQFSACVSLCYNIGPTAFKNSAVVRTIQSGNIKGASEYFKNWNRGGGRVLPGLVSRRAAETKLYNS